MVPVFFVACSLFCDRTFLAVSRLTFQKVHEKMAVTQRAEIAEQIQEEGMRLRDFINERQTVKRELLIGREIEVLDQKALILGLQTRDEEIDGVWEEVTKLYLLHEEVLEEDEWDEEEDWDEDFERKTNRQMLIELMDVDCEPGVTEIGTFVIGGQEFAVEEMEDIGLVDQPYDLTVMLQRAGRAGLIAEHWLEKDLEELWVAAYSVEPAMFDLAWNADILGIGVRLEPMAEDVLVGKVFECKCERPDVPWELFVKDKLGNDVPVRIYGMALYDIWGHSDDWELDEEERGELELLCGRQERLLMIEYSTAENLQMNFYTREYLDAEAYEEEGPGLYGGWGVIPEQEDRRCCVLDVVPEDFDEIVEVELLSYTVFREDAIEF